ncbi:hypothetical protein PYJP_09630 [Pyrofollis japonicus]|uniref:hypothetical protein n=1 Tax=Pyrofollis japonicus TaxID=3060460 RepID=UPI00295B7D48|nr:hypothetical protein [Pyrofollis japonicus]BEP17611.1 hypothetical protein PYJP_09630 [Pyrofollis japonicus]
MTAKHISNEELERILSQAEERERKDPKKRWIMRMLRSAKQYHKMCPYYDKRTGKCFLKLGERCERDGKFDGCPVFIEWLSQKYDELKAKGRPLPMDFLDLTLAV